MNNPFFYFKVWRGGSGGLVGSQLTFEEYQIEMKQRPVLHSFTGRLATIAIISNEVTVTRKEKLDFAINFMKGNMATIHVNLKDLTVTTNYPTKPPCY